METNEFFQDNHSAMKLEKNGKRSRGPGFRQIYIEYFLMKNRLDTQKIIVIYCPTGEMLIDFYTKPLRGSIFRKFRDVIMGLRHASSLKREITIVDQERARNNGTSDLNKTVKIKINKTVMEDVSRSVNVDNIHSDISRK